jgi:hypothetical protein
MEKLGAKDRKDIVSVARYYGLIEEEALHSGNGKACSV